MIDRNGAKCHHLRPMLKEIDDGFDIVFDYKSESYIITHNEGHFQTIKYGEVTQKTFADIRHTVWINKHGDVLDYIDQENEKAEAAEDRAMSNITEAMAHDLRKPLMDHYLYGKE